MYWLSRFVSPIIYNMYCMTYESQLVEFVQIVLVVDWYLQEKIVTDLEFDCYTEKAAQTFLKLSLTKQLSTIHLIRRVYIIEIHKHITGRWDIRRP